MVVKVYRIKKEHVLEVADVDPSTCELAYIKGYSFLRCKESYYILNTNKKRIMLEMNLVEVDLVV